MQIYKAPVRDIRFILETFGYEKVSGLDCFEDFDLDTTMALIAETGKFATNELLPMNRIADQEGVQFDPETKSVKTPDGYKSLYKKFIESGLAGMTLPAEHGGGGAPHIIAIAISEMSTACNKSFTMCPGLGHGTTVPRCSKTGSSISPPPR